MAVVAPVWNIIYSLGLLMGIGGSVIFSAKRGENDKSGEVKISILRQLQSARLCCLSRLGLV